MAGRGVALLLFVVLALPSNISAGAAHQICWPGFTLPAVTLPATTLPAVTLPATTLPASCFAGTCYPAQHFAAQHFPAQHFPAQHFPAKHFARTCFPAGTAPAPEATTVRVSHYASIDASYSPTLSTRYWTSAGPTVSIPNVYAPGFGGFNAAGFPKDQYVRSYIRRDGTFVGGYWRNSPSDGLPTCQIIRC